MHRLDWTVSRLPVDGHHLQNVLLVGDDRLLQNVLLLGDDRLLQNDSLVAEGPPLQIDLLVAGDFCRLLEIVDTNHNRTATKALSGEVVVVSLPLSKI
jgi:hypothetical protein